MGGYGSGRWYGRERRQIVENCFSISADDLPFITRPDETVLLPLKKHKGESLGNLSGELAHFQGETSALTIQVPLNDQTVRQVIPLGSTAVRANGERVAFLCPVHTGDGLCGKTCRKLYLPPRANLFGCRRCHQLSYASRQRRMERLKRADAVADDLIEEASDLFQRVQNGQKVSFEKQLKLAKRLGHATFDLTEFINLRDAEAEQI